MKIFNPYLNYNIDISEILNKHNIEISLDSLKEIYNSPERKYHTFSHIVSMLESITFYSEELIVALLFHDIVYNPFSSSNEADSVAFFKSLCSNVSPSFVKSVESTIMATAELPENAGKNEKEIYRVDRIILYSDSLTELLDWENKIFKEYQLNRVSLYRKGRADFLQQAYNETKNEKLLLLKEIVENKRYKIGFYPGSFNPFHIGHYNILVKAEKVFDKVIIGIGKNFDKMKNEKYTLPKVLQSREVIEYNGIITTVIEELSHEGEIFIVRGLRNEYDLQYEENLRNSIKDFLPDQNFTYFFCDKEFEHISSSLIRDIKSRNDKNSDKFLKKYCLE